MKTRKTLWTVDYTGVGYFNKARMYFEHYEEAKKFSERDYADNPVKRTYTEENARQIIAEAKMYDEFGE